MLSSFSIGSNSAKVSAAGGAGTKSGKNSSKMNNTKAGSVSTTTANNKNTASPAKSKPPDNTPTANQRSQHRAVINIVHTKTLSLARTVQKYPRKHRDLSGVLGDAVEALDEFKGIEWPPRKAEMEEILGDVPSWLGGEEGSEGNASSGHPAGKMRENRTVSESSSSATSESAHENNNNDAASAVAASDNLDKELEELEDADVNDEKEAEKLHQEVLRAGEKDFKDEAKTGDDSEEKGAAEKGEAENNSQKNKGDGSAKENGAPPEKEASTGKEEEKTAAIKRFESIVQKETQPQAPPPPNSKSQTPKSSNRKTNNSHVPAVDAAAMEPMHPAVITALHALCMVISSESKTPKMAELALECITILTNGRYVSGVAGGRMKLEQQKKLSDSIASGKGGKLQQQIKATVMMGEPNVGHDGRDGGLSFLGYVVESITRASDSSSESVQGGMAKALLAIMTCPKCGVHEAAMLQAVRSTFHVYLVGKTVMGKELAKRTLVDMLKCVFNRMEAYDAVSKDNGGETSGESEGKNVAVAIAAAKTIEEDDNATVATATTANTAATNGTKEGSTIDDVVGSAGTFASQYHTDSYLLFRALCKLSSKTLPGDENIGVVTGASDRLSMGSAGGMTSYFSGTPVVDPLALNSKILSLELILAVFEHCGDAFRQGEKFVYAVQSYLCVSLLKNCMSNQTAVAHLSLKIFLLLVRKFKAHLKSEIEVFVANIFLRVLESPNSPFEQKVLVLEALRALCADPQMLTQLFLNYDCDFDAVNLFKDIVHHVTRISAKACAPSSGAYAGSSHAAKKIADQELDLSRTGLEVLVVILRSFLKSLGMPGGDDVFDESGGSLSLLRQTLKIDIGLDNALEKDSDVSLERSDSMEGPLENNSNTAPEPPSDVAGKIVDAFDKKRTAQQNFEIGRVKFKLSLKGGLSFFIENGFCQLDAQDVARFLYENSEELDKTQIGEVLGKEVDSAFVKVKAGEEEVDSEKGGNGFFLRVLYHYVDMMEFTDRAFDDAIRLFLSGFRLPGEAQKIDRIMEKFAERFTRQNEKVFPSPDTAFILGFSVIMLNTDLHNPSIKPERRMTLESFIRNNKGIADGGDLPVDFLTGIFNRIKEEPFSLKEDDEAREKVNKETNTFDSLFVFDTPTIFGSSAEEKKREKFRKEREEMMAASEQLFKKRPALDRNYSKKFSHESTQNQSYDSVLPADVVKPMFDVTWGPLIGTLSQVLESSTNETSIALCLSGFVYSIRISSHNGMSLARDTFVNSLAKFTTLGSIKEMKSKNIECIRTLLSIAIIDGEYLGESWSPILQCISQLGRLHLFASGLDSEDEFLQTGSLQLTKISEAAREMEENNGKAVLAAVNEVLIDKVFSSSVTLSARGVVSFIEQLIAVSNAEILGDTKKGISGVSSSSASTMGNQRKGAGSAHGIEGPRIFSLQRLVEVADYNMNIRPRLTWSQIWESMGNHFAKVGCDDNAMVSMFAIDALRQLSFKFLEKPELTDFNFQRLFLKPFLLIMKNPGSREDIRELVLRCVDNMIRTLAHNLRSGWKIFFFILMLSSSDPSVKINTLGLAILQRLLDEHLDDLCPPSADGEGPVTDSRDDEHELSLSDSERSQRNANAEDFVGLCRASLSFVQTEESENPLPIGLSMRALCHTACYADLIADKKVLPPVSGYQHSDSVAPGYTYEGLSVEESLEMAIWRPLLDGLATGMCSSASSISGGVGCLVQRGSAMALRAILLRHGGVFSVSQWSAILNYVLLPAVQIGAESDSSPVTKISSESPSVSSLDFVGEPLRLPPPCDDEGLHKFSAMTQSDESSPSRPLGTAELLVEASFADLRHGGDGDLSKAHRLKKKDADRIVHLQPFPDSWIATTAPIALGMLSDLIYSKFLQLGHDAREVLWPLVSSQLVRWSVGTPQDKVQLEAVTDDEYNGDEVIVDVEEWQPSEALVRIGCKEWSRVFLRVLDAVPDLDKIEAQAWLRTLSISLSDALVKNIKLEEKIREDIVELKLASLGLGLTESHGGVGEGNRNGQNADYLGMLPTLKTRCIASHCLQQYMSTFVDQFAELTAEEEVSYLLKTLNQSRLASSNARKDEDLALAFQEAFFDQWGDGVEEVEAALQGTGGGSGHRGSSKIFFLTQEASATKAVILLLSKLYCPKRSDKEAENISWDTEAFSEPLLMERIIDVLSEFLSSEENDGLLIDPNVWRSASESGGQVAYFCTSFAGVVVDILEMILNLQADKFCRHKASLFPILCSIVRVQSGEIRHLVSDIFRKQIGPMIQVTDSEQKTV